MRSARTRSLSALCDRQRLGVHERLPNIRRCLVKRIAVGGKTIICRSGRTPMSNGLDGPYAQR
jgi:hypothetical protein